MKLLTDFKLAINGYYKAYYFLKKHKLMHYFIVPMILSIIILVGIYFFQDIVIDSVFGLVEDWFNTDNWYEWLKIIFEWFIKLFVWFVSFMIIYKALRYFVFISLTPVLTLLSEKIDTILTGNEYPFELKQLFKDILRGVSIAIRNLSLELFVTGVLILLTHIFPIIAPFTTVIIFLISWYYMGFSFMDFTNERRKLSFKSSIKEVRKNKGIAYGIGCGFNLLFAIPILGWIVAPILATTASTLSLRSHLPQS